MKSGKYVYYRQKKKRKFISVKISTCVHLFLFFNYIASYMLGMTKELLRGHLLPTPSLLDVFSSDMRTRVPCLGGN